MVGCKRSDARCSEGPFGPEHPTWCGSWATGTRTRRSRARWPCQEYPSSFFFLRRKSSNFGRSVFSRLRFVVRVACSFRRCGVSGPGFCASKPWFSTFPDATPRPFSAVSTPLLQESHILHRIPKSTKTHTSTLFCRSKTRHVKIQLAELYHRLKKALLRQLHVHHRTYI